MRKVAAGAAALAVVISLAGCGGSADQTETVNVSLPGYSDTSSPIGHVAAPGRRVNAHDGSGARHRTASSATADVQASRPPQIKPLTKRADAKLNGVSVWIPYWGLSAAVSSAVENAGVVKVAHPFIYEIEGTDDVVDQSGGEARSVSRELSAAHLDVIPTVTETDDMAQFAAVLMNPKKQAALLTALESIAEQPDNNGIDLDFENLAYGTGNAKQIEEVEVLYPELVGKLCQKLHQTNRSCEVTVFAKNTSGISDASGLSTYVYNYSALADVADRLQLMAYDLHGPSSAAGPIAPLPWVRSVLKYALSQMPADKIVLGVPAYGYDWSTAGGADAVTATSAPQLASDEHARVEWDPTDEEAYFSYTTATTTVKKIPQYTTKHTVHVKKEMVNGQPRTAKVTVTTKVKHLILRRTVHHTGHTVWFENSTADYDRAVLAADENLAGIAIWAGGDESPGLWSTLARLTH